MTSPATRCIFTALLLLSAGAHYGEAHAQAQTILPSTAQCGEKYITTYEITKCVSEVQNQLAPILKRVVEATRQHMQYRIASENEPRYVDELRQAAASFDKAQAAWEQYRDFQCDATATEFLGGTGRAAGYLGCLADITRVRILELWSATGLPPPK